MKNTFLILVLLILHGLVYTAFGQKRIAALGSSTTFGAAASSGQLSWVGRLQAFYRANASDGVDTVIDVKGGYGYTTYKVLPTGYVAPIPREAIDPANNITAALSLNPDIVIINLPSNDVAGFAYDFVTPPYNTKETMDNFRLLYQTAIAAGKACFVATTQPRNDLNAAQRQLQKNLRDSILNTFGQSSINFWDDLVTNDGLLGLRDEVRHLGFPDADYHLNDEGHRLLYERVRAKNIFAVNSPLPLHLTSFTALVQNQKAVINWGTVDEEANTVFEIERSGDGQNFKTVYFRNGGGGSRESYQWTDDYLPLGKTFYRLKIIESGRLRYSKAVIVTKKGNSAFIENVAVTGSLLTAVIQSPQAASVQLSIVNATGAVLLNEKKNLQAGKNSFHFVLDAWATGAYFIQLHTSEGVDVKRFQQLK